MQNVGIRRKDKETPASQGYNERAHMLIHIGYPKTGSTWFQRSMLESGCSDLVEVMSRNDVRDLLLKPGLWYDSTAIEELMSPRIADALRRKRVPVVSHELLVGNPHVGGHDSSLLAERLHGSWPDAKILIVIREQQRMLLSLYKEYIWEGDPHSLRGYMLPRQRIRRPSFDFRYFEFDRLIVLYRKLFGEKSVLVLTYELLRQDALEFTNRILEFVDASRLEHVSERKVRGSLRGTSIRIRSITNPLFHSNTINTRAWVYVPHVAWLVHKLDGLWPQWMNRFFDRRMAGLILRLTEGRFLDSNRTTETLTSCDLESEGYLD